MRISDWSSDVCSSDLGKEIMAKTTSYRSKVPDAEGNLAYDAAENAVWRDLRVRQRALLPGRVCNAFLKGLDLLELPADRVPQVKEVNARLQEISGFGVEPVPALDRKSTRLNSSN